MGPTLTDFEKFHPPQNKNPPSTFIDFLDFSTLTDRNLVRSLLEFSTKSAFPSTTLESLVLDWEVK